jgi:hypothetical protein
MMAPFMFRDTPAGLRAIDLPPPTHTQLGVDLLNGWREYPEYIYVYGRYARLRGVNGHAVYRLETMERHDTHRDVAVWHATLLEWTRYEWPAAS